MKRRAVDWRPTMLLALLFAALVSLQLYEAVRYGGEWWLVTAFGIGGMLFLTVLTLSRYRRRRPPPPA